ncbi:acyl-CoA dehydrogenase family protein [Nocardia brevicatena]|uniref:acyl-CoA dehydrogenase family protein n=1 Tax=Nocardia brevicatena TaxID=37327 RepID=UPI00031B8C39|nr:acyl-CoA dehydrogenase family protein [Nocardia brevicatena]
MILRDDPDMATLREVVRDFLDEGEVAAASEDRPRWDPARWSRACSELGLAGVAEPEALGGAGIGGAGLAIVLEEAGRVLSPLPILGSVVLGQGLLARAGDAEARAAMLPALLDGSRTATVALGALRDDGTVPEDLEAVADVEGRWTITGSTSFVLDGATADWVFLRAGTPDGPRLFVIDTEDRGVATTVQNSMDLTRSFARLDLAAAVARPLGAAGTADAVLTELRTALTVAVACEQLGGAEQALRMAVEYAKVRVQFGREIGSFQAVKHRCADLAILLDDARSALAHAIWALHEEPDRLRMAAPMAAVVCSRAFLDCARENIQLHGGIGFTWEHPAHLYFRRATSDAALFGDVNRHREDVLTAMGI